MIKNVFDEQITLDNHTTLSFVSHTKEMQADPLIRSPVRSVNSNQNAQNRLVN